MSDTLATLPVETAEAIETDTNKIRGRIPRAAWGYVRGQYELAGRTYEDIGNEFNSTPSAVFYVVKQANKFEIAATLEKPDMSALPAALPRQATLRAPRATAPQMPSQIEQMAAQANAWLSNEACRRLFEASTNTIVGYASFESEPSEALRKQVKDAIHETRRSLASLELKLEMASIAPRQQPANQSGQPGLASTEAAPAASDAAPTDAASLADVA